MKPEGGDDRLRGHDSPAVRPRCMNQPLPAHVTATTHSELEFSFERKELKWVGEDTH